MYPDEITAPMRQELTTQGFTEFTTEQEVSDALDAQSGTSIVLVNSVCGCAAGSARPGVIASLDGDKKPDNLYTVFAGVHKEATNKAREYMMPFPPSSPAIAIFKDGQLAHMIERHHIEGRPADMLADHLKQAYNEFC